MKRSMFLGVAIGLAFAVRAVPQLATQAEIVAEGELRLKVLAGARGVPAPTPQSRNYRVTRGDETKEVKFFRPADLWRQRAFAGEWKDKKGNRMFLARVKSLVPVFEREDWYKEEIEAKLDDAEKAFQGTESERETWRKAWDGGTGAGRFIDAKNGATYFLGFEFAETVKPAEAEKLLKAAERSLSTLTKGNAGAVSSMKWWKESTERYVFLTDLDKAKGGKFIADAIKLMEAMRKSYEFYVPPQRKTGVGTVRVFKTLAGYREYRQSTGEEDRMSCGLWDPSREELLIAAEDPRQARDTMRHEAFHQYLHDATGRGDHAMWFNEGHACFFENVKYNPAQNSVKVTDEGNRAMGVAKNPERIARAIASVLKKDRAAFYSGDVNLNYCTAWAIVYFLEKGAYTSEAFAPYRTICPAYLAAMKEGLSPDQATERAWSAVKDRDIAADFLRFWKEKRKAALNAR